ncbi:hypothetical protein PUMCH_001696 [Australozyma saopauloensis]|uniref:rRNA-processing protein EFG1 n=1 Tax=Australozyma saopauloensis TaxID=291208 RepID=A0AAX4H757_9ASCO|nr:hypothetical protein PUMCH_001696 [[Candida] saopauloensis]
MPKTDRRIDRSGTDLSDVLGSSARARKKIKSIEGLLQRDNLPADVRIEKERALKALQADLKNTLFKLKTQKRAKKYHMVRFFERKKALRKLKQAKKALDEATETAVKKDIKKARRAMHHCQVDVAYVFMFPKSEKYISLYPAENSELDDNEKKGKLLTDEKRLEFKKKVEELIESDRLPFTFEDALDGKTIIVDNIKWPEQTKEIDAPTAVAEAVVEEDDFFE